MKILQLVAPAVIATLLCAAPASAATIELTSNGDFETGDTTDWDSFPSGNSSFGVVTGGEQFAGNFAGKVENLAPASPAVIKQANLGVGVVQPNGQLVNISFWAKGFGNAGGVHFAEFFSEVDPSGVSKSEILGGGPLFPGVDWTEYTFQATTGPDVSGGVTLQFAAVTGGDNASTSTLFVDNVSVTVEGVVIPEPTSAALLAVGGLGLLVRRRRHS